jgi:hypothetical protein
MNALQDSLSYRSKQFHAVSVKHMFQIGIAKRCSLISPDSTVPGITTGCDGRCGLSSGDVM